MLQELMYAYGICKIIIQLHILSSVITIENSNSLKLLHNQRGKQFISQRIDSKV